MLQKFFAFALLILIAASCSKDDTVDYGPIDDKIIKDYLAANNLTAESTSSGLYYIITTPGSTIHPTINNEVKVKYKGYLTDGSIFDQSTYTANKPATLPLNGLVKGWQEGLPFIGVGGQIKLLVPSALGYGSTQKTNSTTGKIIVPANSVLIFDIDLQDFY
jgi:FKBP-type peptidyl-prolyl cis-trans isomerase FkpA